MKPGNPFDNYSWIPQENRKVHSVELLFECVRQLMLQVHEEQKNREALVKALNLENRKPITAPTDEEVSARIEEIEKIIQGYGSRGI